jgi:hypothetical protein
VQLCWLPNIGHVENVSQRLKQIKSMLSPKLGTWAEKQSETLYLPVTINRPSCS